jgi:hypothetical protein
LGAIAYAPYAFENYTTDDAVADYDVPSPEDSSISLACVVRGHASLSGE